MSKLCSSCLLLKFFAVLLQKICLLLFVAVVFFKLLKEPVWKKYHCFNRSVVEIPGFQRKYFPKSLGFPTLRNHKMWDWIQFNIGYWNAMYKQVMLILLKYNWQRPPCKISFFQSPRNVKNAENSKWLNFWLAKVEPKLVRIIGQNYNQKDWQYTFVLMLFMQRPKYFRGLSEDRCKILRKLFWHAAHSFLTTRSPIVA